MLNKTRIRKLNKEEKQDGPVIYWMSRDQRVQDNWALLTAQETAKSMKQPFAVVFCLTKGFLGATLRQYDFMLKGLQEVESELKKLNIPFILLDDVATKSLPKFVEENKIGAVITDFSPLRVNREWKKELVDVLRIPLWEVDAHNIIPAWVISDKEEFAARTIRPKVHRNLDEYLTDFPKVEKQKLDWPTKANPVNWKKIHGELEVDKNVKPVDWIKPGTKNAFIMMNKFIEEKLINYDEKRNDPNAMALSNMSPYYHFGQMAPQRVAIELTKIKNEPSTSPDTIVNVDAYLEEMIVRRELADNFCFYNPNYDNIEGFKDWAKKTHSEHKEDAREYVYTKDEFEQAETHEDLWNAAQMEMVKTGKMHGYMRMYWAKKIFEWTNSPEEAMEIAIYLNDKYLLDGRDPNGYTGIAWSIGGIHDRAWFEREVFGKIRYMNHNGAKRKFKVEEYVGRWLG